MCKPWKKSTQSPCILLNNDSSVTDWLTDWQWKILLWCVTDWQTDWMCDSLDWLNISIIYHHSVTKNMELAERLWNRHVTMFHVLCVCVTPNKSNAISDDKAHVCLNRFAMPEAKSLDSSDAFCWDLYGLDWINRNWATKNSFILNKEKQAKDYWDNDPRHSDTCNIVWSNQCCILEMKHLQVVSYILHVCAFNPLWVDLSRRFVECVQGQELQCPPLINVLPLFDKRKEALCFNPLR